MDYKESITIFLFFMKIVIYYSEISLNKEPGGVFQNDSQICYRNDQPFLWKLYQTWNTESAL